MNIRDVHGVTSAQDLYEVASHHGLHVSSIDKLVRFVVDMQSRALAAQNSDENKEKDHD
ncbi:hypothetical protein WCQ02_31160 [Paraburkholderia tropica]|uniref:hypothetical protein n=1 Tax=Paraburkholderia tropica TaxID=92647 RepID=UPI0030166A61